MLDFRYRTFLDLAKELNYTKTAQNLYVTQPTITKHIQNLEKEWQVKLVDYQHKQLRLTEQGAFLYKELATIQAKIEEIEHTLKPGKKETDTLMIGASHAIGEYYLHQQTDFFEQDTLPYHLIIENPTILLDKLEKGEIDCALIADDLPSSSPFDSFTFFQDEIALVCSASQKRIPASLSLEELKNYPLIIREPESGIVQSLNRQLNQYGFDLKSCSRIKHIGNSDLIKKLLVQGQECALLYKVMMQTELNETAVLRQITLKETRLTQDFHLVFPHKHQKRDRILLLKQLIQQKRPSSI